MAITGMFSYQLLAGDIIRGIASTAPFSQWSFGVYIARIMPVLQVALLFFIASLYSSGEKQVGEITAATAMDKRQYLMIRYFAILVGFMMMLAVPLLLSFVFYAIVFGYFSYGRFFLPVLVVVVPGLLLTFGTGLVMGRIHHSLVYVLMIIVVILSLLSLPQPLDLNCEAYFQSTPLSMPQDADGEVSFFLPAGIVLSRVAAALLGAVLVAASLLLKQRHQ